MTNKMFGKALSGFSGASEVFTGCFSQELQKKRISSAKIVG
jgi:hypothetical protein